MGGSNSVFNPVGNNFLGGGKTFGRIGGDVLTGGLAEFGRNDPFGIPINNPIANALGNGPNNNIQIPGYDPSLIANESANQKSLFDQAQGDTQSLTSKALQGQRGFNADYINQLQGLDATQNDLLNQRLTSQRDQLLNQLTSGPEGEAFREKYNNLGLLNSGAFNTGLANQFGNLAAQQQQDLLNLGINQQNQLASAYGQGYGNLSGIGQQGFLNQQDLLGRGLDVQSGLGIAGLGRRFDLQDQQTQANLAQILGDQSARNQNTGAILGGASNVLGKLVGRGK